MCKQLRLTKKRDFQDVYENGDVFKNRYLVMLSLKKENSGKNRTGYAVGKRLGTAVERNRIKRLLKEAYRQKDEGVKRGYDLIFIARGPIKGKSFLETQDALLDVLHKAGHLKK